MKIEHLLFDLDNTLYSCTAKMDESIGRRMTQCVADFFSVSFEEAGKLRRENIRNFSTTLEWLRSEGFTDIEGFFAKVHPENEADDLPSDPDLRPLLESIKIPKSILTNAPREHAERVLNKLNVRNLFDAITDIRDCNLMGKPYKAAYEIALAKTGSCIANTVFLDDQFKYCDGYIASGGTAVVVGNQNGHHINEGSPAAPKMDVGKTGREFRITSVYDLPDLLEKLINEKL